jgi:hypothetical protein
MVHNHHGHHQSLMWLWVLIGVVFVLPVVITVVWLAVVLNTGKDLIRDSCKQGRSYSCSDEVTYGLCHDEDDPSYNTSCCKPGKAQWVDWGLPEDDYATQCSQSPNTDS